MYSVIEELESNIESTKQLKKDFILECETHFKRGGGRKDGEDRFKYYLEKNPKSQESRRLKDLEGRLRHLVKQLERQKSHAKEIQDGL
jgi:hypothetical protein